MTTSPPPPFLICPVGGGGIINYLGGTVIAAGDKVVAGIPLKTHIGHQLSQADDVTCNKSHGINLGPL